MIYYLYRHRRLDTNQIFYVGIGSRQINNYEYRRARATSPTKRSQFWHNIFNKTNVRAEIVLESKFLDEILDKEKEFISLYGRRDSSTGSLVNLTDGGDGAFNKVWSEEEKIVRSKLYSGKGNPFYGKEHSKETIDILRIKCANFGEENGFYRKRHSTQTKELIGNVQKQRWLNGQLKAPPPNYKIYLMINHNSKVGYIVRKGLRYFCKNFNLNYEYIRKYINKGPIMIARITKTNASCIGWEKVDLNDNTNKRQLGLYLKNCKINVKEYE